MTAMGFTTGYAHGFGVIFHASLRIFVTENEQKMLGILNKPFIFRAILLVHISRYFRHKTICRHFNFKNS